jgi:hypothetical protein
MTASTHDLARRVLLSLDNAWNPLVERLAGLTEAEYHWEPVAGCWTVRRAADNGWVADWEDPDPDPAPVPTIAWRCWHIAVDCLDSYSARVFGASGTGLTGTQWVGTWPEARAHMAASYAVLRAGVAAWSDRDLLVPLGPRFPDNATRPNVDLALHAEREIIHHGAEIGLLRDLYRFR